MTPYIIGIDTSTTNCSVGLFQGAKLLVSKEVNNGYSHSENLAVMVEEVLSEAQLSRDALNAVAVGIGPGSYTGLRIGVSLAKGLAFGLDIPILAISSLKLMAAEVHDRLIQVEAEDVFLPLLDARRMEVYSAAYDFQLQELESPQAIILESDSFLALKNSNGRLFVMGPGAAKMVDQSSAADTLLYIEDVFPSVKGMGKLAYEAFLAEDFVDTAYFEPFYLKDFIAGKPSRNLLSPDS